MTENSTISYTDYLGERIDRGRAEVEKSLHHYYPFGQRLNLPGYQSSDANPYLYNGKELQEDLRLRWYDYGARFYDAQVGRFYKPDPIAEDFKNHSIYVYADNNPIKYIDFMGMNAGKYITNGGKIIGDDGEENTNIHIVTKESNISTIKRNDRNGGITKKEDVDIEVTTSLTELEEVLHVLGRTEGFAEEGSVVTPEGEIYRAESGNGMVDKLTSVDLPYVEGDKNTSIHSHPTAVTETGGFDAKQPGPDDPETFKKYKSNIIVGAFGAPEINEKGHEVYRKEGAAFFDRNITTSSKPKVTMTKKAIGNVIDKMKNK